MCGRFSLTQPREAVAQAFDAALDPEAAPRAEASWNICPTRPVDAVIATPEGRLLTALRWGFVPRWYKTPEDGPLLINARSETIAEKPAFRDACRRRRCLIPASGFYEWQPPERSGGRGKRPHWIAPAEGGLFAFAGVWEVWQGPDGRRVPACAIVTAAAGPTLEPLHHREPVRIAPEAWGLWLGEEGPGAARLMHAAPEGFWAFHEVSTRVNGVRDDDPELILPVGEAGPPAPPGQPSLF